MRSLIRHWRTEMERGNEGMNDDPRPKNRVPPLMDERDEPAPREVPTHTQSGESQFENFLENLKKPDRLDMGR